MNSFPQFWQTARRVDSSDLRSFERLRFHHERRHFSEQKRLVLHQYQAQSSESCRMSGQRPYLSSATMRSPGSFYRFFSSLLSGFFPFRSYRPPYVGRPESNPWSPDYCRESGPWKRFTFHVLNLRIKLILIMQLKNCRNDFVKIRE